MSETAIVEVEEITFDETLLATDAQIVVAQEDPATGDDDKEDEDEDEEDVDADGEDDDDDDEDEDDDDKEEAV